ncbi:MAG: GNAT family N-acetyltransferase [Hyphomicrobiaceae bacterium]
MPDITLRPLQAADWDQVRAWLLQAEIQAWWGGLAAAEAEVAIAAESPSAVCRLILAAATPIGYGHALDADLVRSPRTEGLPPGTYLAALFIADPAHRQRGAGETALAALTREVFSSTLAPACATLVPVRYEPAVRAAERAGYRWTGIRDDGLSGQSWLMISDRP